MMRQGKKNLIYFHTKPTHNALSYFCNEILFLSIKFNNLRFSNSSTWKLIASGPIVTILQTMSPEAHYA